MEWQDWTEEETTKQYSPSHWSKRFENPNEVIEDYIRRITEGSELAKSTLPFEEGVSTGYADDCKIDIFYPNSTRACSGSPVFVFIYGGWWEEGSRSHSSWMAPCLTAAGAVVVVFGYTLAPKANMSMIVQEMTSSLIFLLHWARRNGCSGIYLCGHSAGAQLVAMMTTIKWVQEHMVSPTLIKGIILVSGIYDLEPFTKTKYNSNIKLSESDVSKFSPLNLLQPPQIKTCPYWVVYGGQEGQEFHRQSQAYHKFLLAAGINSVEKKMDECDHFDIVLNLAQPSFTLTKDIFKMLGCVSKLMGGMDISKGDEV